jgi:hypothetical protein
MIGRLFVYTLNHAANQAARELQSERDRQARTTLRVIKPRRDVPLPSEKGEPLFSDAEIRILDDVQKKHGLRIRLWAEFKITAGENLIDNDDSILISGRRK